MAQLLAYEPAVPIWEEIFCKTSSVHNPAILEQTDGAGSNKLDGYAKLLTIVDQLKEEGFNTDRLDPAELSTDRAKGPRNISFAEG